MDQRNRIRLGRLESDIADTELKYKEELEIERLLNKTTLLMSRVYLKKLETLQARKNKMERVARSARERRRVYDDVLQQRIDAVNTAELALTEIAVILENMNTMSSINRPTDFNEQRTMYVKILHSRKIILANKKRALNNWLERPEAITPISKMADTTDGIQGDENGAKASTIKIASVEEIQKRYQEHLASLSGKNINNASIDLLTQPVQDFVENNPFALNEPKKRIVI